MQAPSGRSERFGVLRGARRLWAVGAIHAEAERLAALHEQLEARLVPGDRLVYLGNYLGRGARVIETVTEILLFRRATMARLGLCPDDIIFLRGAQEEMWQKLLQLHLAQNPGKVLDWMLAQGVGATLSAYGGRAEVGRARCREGALSIARWTSELREAVRAHPGHDALMASLRRAAFAEDGRILFVHAGIDPTRPLTVQTDSFWWGTRGFADLRGPYETFERLVRGYDPAHGGLRIEAVAATVDSGCGFGGPLTAACFDRSGALLDRVEG